MKKLAFTMAEILLSLTIIGVVAAITLPSLMGNINERTWNTQRKALHARMSQAIAMMPSLNGYGTYIADTKDAAGSVTSSGTDTAAEAFLTEGLSKVLKINNICDADNLTDCGLPEQMYKTDGTVGFSSLPKTLEQFNSGYYMSFYVSAPQMKTAAFETQNGESILTIYNPQCNGTSADLLDSPRWKVPLNYVCANFIYDLNGNKGPNTFGKDVGIITALYPVDSNVVAPNPIGFVDNSGVSVTDMNTYCRTNFDPTSRLSNLEETIALVTNKHIALPHFSSSMLATLASVGSTSKYALNAVPDYYIDQVSSGSFVCVKY